MIASLERRKTMEAAHPGPAGSPREPRRRPRRARRPAGQPAPERLVLHLPPFASPAPADLGWAGAVLVAFGLLAYGAARLPTREPARDETVEWIEESPPPPVEEIEEPPELPPPPPPDPDEAPPPTRTEQAPPVFGLSEDAVSEVGDMAVATGNTLRAKADSVVQAPPQPLAAAPVELDRTPAFLRRAVADYPEWAQDQGVEARVLVWVTIDTEGRVTDASLKRGAGKDFDVGALKAARASLFQPLVRDGARLPSRFVVTYDFRLEG